MTALARAMKALITRARRSVQIASLRNPRLCQELVRSTTHRLPAWSGKPFLADHTIAAEFVEQVTGLGQGVVGVEMHCDVVGQTDAHALIEPAEMLQRRRSSGESLR